MKLYSCFAIDHPFYISCYEICLHLYEVSTSKIAKLMILLLSWYHCMAPTMQICYIWKIPAWSLIDILIVNNSHFYAFWLSLYHSHWAFQLFIFLFGSKYLIAEQLGCLFIFSFIYNLRTMNIKLSQITWMKIYCQFFS